jgi:glycosyltransferase involved in cell wall biosynthesis
MTARVQLLHTVYPHMGNHTAAMPFVRQLRQQGCQVAVMSVHDGDDDFPIRNIVIRGILRNRLSQRMPWYKLSDFVAEFRAAVQCLRGAYDIVHYFDGEHSARYLSLWLKTSRLSGRTVATFHQPPEILAQLVDRRVVARLDRVVVVSPTQRGFFEQWVPADRVRVILLGVDAEYFRPRDRPPTPGPLRCITVGHWLRDWAALRALAELLIQRRADIELHVVTNRETGLEGLPNVRRYQGLSDQRLLAAYQQSDVLLLPLTGSTANNALLEGLACGLPIISTRLPSVEAYVPASAGLLVEVNDPELLFRSLEAVRADEDRRAAMARAARARAEELSWERVAACYAALYSELQ